MELNTKHQFYKVSRKDREKLHGHKSFVIWLTGLSGSGKSTLANLLEIYLNKNSISTYVLDGDNIRGRLNKDLTFSPEDRKENIRRIAEISYLMINAGIITIVSTISPYKRDREFVKELIGKENFSEIYINASVEECEKRDVKGLYKKARSGSIKNLTGISSPYEAPFTPDLEICTQGREIRDCLNELVKFVKTKL